MQLAIT